ncbi:MAG TPA: CBS domain-containing protein [Gemmatimonadota bacterium]|nr:CBS domain-containing protein [Gemmatimonadota bacterium]
MNVQDILSRKASNAVRTIAPDRTVEEAVAQLVAHNIGSLIVMDQGRPAGIVTERDILRCCANGMGKSASTRVADVMTRDLIVGEAGDSVDYVMGIMTRNRIRHLPIVDRKQGILGMVSIGDVVESQLHETKYENRHLKQYISGTY